MRREKKSSKGAEEAKDDGQGGGRARYLYSRGDGVGSFSGRCLRQGKSGRECDNGYQDEQTKHETS